MATMLWSAKEAVYKFADIQGLDFSKDILVTNHTADTLHIYLPRFKKESIVHYFFLQDFVLTYAIQGHKQKQEKYPYSICKYPYSVSVCYKDIYKPPYCIFIYPL